MEEATNFIRATGQMAQSTNGFGFHVREAENAGSPQPVGFHLSPYAVARIQVRVGDQESPVPMLSASKDFPDFWPPRRYYLADCSPLTWISAVAGSVLLPRRSHGQTALGTESIA